MRLLAFLERLVVAMFSAPAVKWSDPVADIEPAPTPDLPVSHVHLVPAPSPVFDESYEQIHDEASFSRWLKGGAA